MLPGTSVDSAFDSKVKEAFAERLPDLLNSGALCLMVSQGRVTGSFDILRVPPPATSEEIAARAGLQERSLREQLRPIGERFRGGISI